MFDLQKFGRLVSGAYRNIVVNAMLVMFIGFLALKIIYYIVLLIRNIVRRIKKKDLILRKWGMLILVYFGIAALLAICYFIKLMPLDAFLEITIGCLGIVIFIALNALVTYRKIIINFDPDMNETRGETWIRNDGQ